MSRRLGILLSHAIQYYSPWFRHLSQRMQIEVFYAHRQDAKGQAAAGFGVEFEWDTPLLEGYPHRWLNNVARRPSVATFRGCDTPELYDLIRNDRFDAFLICGWNHKSALQAMKACWQSGVPLLVRGDSQLETRRSWVKSVLKYLPYRAVLPRLSAHLYVGRRNKAYLQHYGVPESRLFFAPHFVDAAFFAGAAQEAEASGKTALIRAELGLPEEAFVFLFVGKMIPKKRPADFVEACLKLFAQSDGSGIHAVLVGDGPLRGSLESQARPFKDRFHFAGFRNQGEMAAFYRLADALVLSSDSRETWGLVVNEAMACGIPAVVSDAAGCSADLVETGRTGYCYRVGDAEELANRMLALKITCEKSGPQMKKALAEKVGTYSMENATAGLERAMAAVAG